MGCGVASGTECKAGVELDAYDVIGALTGCRQRGIVGMPTWNDPDAFADLNRAELRLSEPYPVFIGYVAQEPLVGRRYRPGVSAKLLDDLLRIKPVRQQGHYPIVAPGLNGRFQAGLTIQRAFIGRIAVGVF